MVHTWVHEFTSETSELVAAREITASFCGAILPIVREVQVNLHKCTICADLVNPFNAI